MKEIGTIVGFILYIFIWGTAVMVCSAAMFLWGRWCAQLFGWY